MGKNIQFNSKEFAVTRNTLNAYFGAKFELAEALDKASKRVKNYATVIATDKAELARIALGDTDGIIRTADEIRTSLKVNTATYEKGMKSYNALVTKTADAITKGEDLFNGKTTALYKAYVAYVETLDDATYKAYVDAMVLRFVELGLKDACADNVTVYMVNADRERKGRAAVKKGDIQGALSPKAFAQAVLRKIYVTNKTMFASDKFVAYVQKCAEKASAK